MVVQVELPTRKPPDRVPLGAATSASMTWTGEGMCKTGGFGQGIESVTYAYTWAKENPVPIAIRTMHLVVVCQTIDTVVHQLGLF
jgi:hypothetical protein